MTCSKDAWSVASIARFHLSWHHDRYHRQPHSVIHCSSDNHVNHYWFQPGCRSSPHSILVSLTASTKVDDVRLSLSDVNKFVKWLPLTESFFEYPRKWFVRLVHSKYVRFWPHFSRPLSGGFSTANYISIASWSVIGSTAWVLSEYVAYVEEREKNSKYNSTNGFITFE